MKPRHAAALVGWAFLFVILHFVFLVGWFLLGLASSGGKVRMPWAIVSLLAIWPSAVLSLVVPDQFFDSFPLLFFVANTAGWAAIGAVVGYFVKFNQDTAIEIQPLDRELSQYPTANLD